MTFAAFWCQNDVKILMLYLLVTTFLNDLRISLSSRVGSTVGSVIKKLMGKTQLPVRMTSVIRFTKKLL